MSKRLVQPISQHRDFRFLAVAKIVQSGVEITLCSKHLCIAGQNSGDVTLDIDFACCVELQSLLHYCYKFDGLLDIGVRSLDSFVQIT